MRKWETRKQIKEGKRHFFYGAEAHKAKGNYSGKTRVIELFLHCFVVVPLIRPNSCLRSLVRECARARATGSAGGGDHVVPAGRGDCNQRRLLRHQHVHAAHAIRAKGHGRGAERPQGMHGGEYF